MLRFIKFQKSYGHHTVLHIDDLCIDPGIYWIRGANGSGKSTLLKAAAGILAFRGDILLNNQISIKEQPVAYRRLVNFAEAEPVFPEFLTGEEMIRMFAAAKHAAPRQQDHLIKSMQLDDYIHHPTGTYSSGMIKKLSVALAFLGNPVVILLDEPMITMDNGSLKVLYQWIAEKHQRDGCSFFLSSHQVPEFLSLPSVKEVTVGSKTLTFET